MANEDPQAPIRRVVVLVDASRTSRAALEEGAQIAARRGAELLGLFVEEEKLVRLAGLPFSREIGPTSGALRPLDPTRIERRLRAQAEDIRNVLDRLSRRYAIPGSFQVSRGEVVAQVMATTAPGDLLVVGKRGWSAVPRNRLGSTPRNLIAESALTIMVLERGSGQSTHPTLALFEEPGAGERVLAIAAQIAQHDSRALTVLLPPRDPETLADLRDRAESWLKAQGIEAQIQVLRGTNPESIADAVRSAEGRALVISRDSPVLAHPLGERVIEAVAPAVVVVP